jgi:hypothetical protein
MATLYDVLANAQHGEALDQISDHYGLTPQQTQAAVAALLPAISMGLKRSTMTPEGLGELLSLMGRQQDLYAMYDDAGAAFSREGRAAGNAVLSNVFGSPDASRAITAQAQQLSGVASSILKKLLPVLAGILISGLMRSGSGRASPSAPPTTPAQQHQGGGLFDILRQIFQQRGAGSQDSSSSNSGQSPVPPIGDILESQRKGQGFPAPERPVRLPEAQPMPMPKDNGGPTAPGGDLLSQILRDLEAAIREGRLKPVVVGPYEIDIPGQAGSAAPGGKARSPGGDILGQILREALGGALGQGRTPRSGALGLKDGAGAALFGDRLEPGSDIEQGQLDSLQEVLDRFASAPLR